MITVMEVQCEDGGDKHDLELLFVNYFYSATLSLHALNLHFPRIYATNLLSVLKGHTISVKMSLNLYFLTFMFFMIVHSNFEVSLAETPSFYAHRHS